MTREENLHWIDQEIKTWENECQSKLDELGDTEIKTYMSEAKAKSSFLNSWWNSKKEDFENGTYKVVKVFQILETDKN